MIDEDPRYTDNDDLPEWIENIIERHELGDRTDCPLAAATVLLFDAAELLKEASLSAHRDQAIAAESRQRFAEAQTMIADAEKLFAFCPTEPAGGSVRGHDGALVWSPEPAHCQIIEWPSQ